MSALDLITLADYKAWAPVTGQGRDGPLSDYIAEASRMIEADIGRRLRYRAPPEVEGAGNIVASRTLADETIPGGSITQPNSNGRTMIVTVTDADRSVVAGTVTVTGTVGGVAGTVETFDLSAGLIQHGAKFFTAISAIVVAVTGEGAGDTIKVGSSLGYIEFHPDARGHMDPTVIVPLEWPVLNILEVNEDASRVYGTSTKLVRDTDYFLTRGGDGDRLVRLSSSLPTAWASGWRAEKLVHSAGYTAATIPDDIKGVCRRLVKLLNQENSENRIEVSSWSGPMGSGSRFGNARLTREMRRQLDPYRRNRFGADRGERDFDQNAA